MSTTNVPQTNPAPPMFNAALGISSTEEALGALQMDIQEGQPVQNAVQTFTGQTWAQGNVFRWE
jgi:hypothetical protein